MHPFEIEQNIFVSLLLRSKKLFGAQIASHIITVVIYQKYVSKYY